MTTTRRRFIRNFGAAAIAAASFSSTGSIFAQISKTEELFIVPPASASDALNGLTREHFLSFVNTFVEVRTGDDRRIQLQLIEVADLKRQANEKRFPGGESFSLLFQDSRKSRLPQDVYPMQHFALGEFSLLLVPTGIKGNRYEAIINRIDGSR
ncbi:MAG TPA: hypothetical protein VF599_14015 [Pyrinomonadaceae bacterium]|jgi:hypothetical protein